MNTFDTCIIITFVTLIIITIYISTNKNNNNNLDKKIKTILTEPFIVSDARDINLYDDFREYTRTLEDNFDKEDIKNPPQSQIVDYNYKDNDKKKG